MDVHTIVQGRSRRWHAWMLELLSWALMLPNEASRPQNLMIQNTHAHTHTLYRQKRGIFMRLHSKRRCISFHHVSLVTICFSKHVTVKVDLGHCPSIFLHSLPRDWKALWPGNGPPEQTGQLQPTKLHRNATIFNHGGWTRSYGYFTSQSKWQKGSIKNQYRDMKQLGLGMINCWAIHPRKYATIELIHKQPHICNHQHMVPTKQREHERTSLNTTRAYDHQMAIIIINNQLSRTFVMGPRVPKPEAQYWKSSYDSQIQHHCIYSIYNWNMWDLQRGSNHFKPHLPHLVISTSGIPKHVGWLYWYLIRVPTGDQARLFLLILLHARMYACDVCTCACLAALT